MNRFLASLLFVLYASIASAQGVDVALVNLVSGDATFTPLSGSPGKVQAFMKLRDGDRIDVPAGAQVRVVFFEGARQERWTGPAGFRAGRSAGEPISGKAADVATLPAGASQRIAQIPQLVQIAKLGGVQLRGMTPAQKASVDHQSTVNAARATYEQMRRDLPADDITPELYFYAVLYEYLRYDDMKAVVDEMRRKQPDNEQVKALESWLLSRTAK
ncbi:MAG TPA: hypothetical protein VMU46_14430 [Burkholderiales bacterium]|nr:hypothetical protein [Burkholderiales bacterium]